MCWGFSKCSESYKNVLKVLGPGGQGDKGCQRRPQSLQGLQGPRSALKYYDNNFLFKSYIFRG